MTSQVEPQLRRAADSGSDVGVALDIAHEIGATIPAQGRGATSERWSTLAALARVNVTVARVTEAHVDALAILDEAGVPASDARLWGVFAAESPDPGTTLRAVRARDWTLSGVKPWCSLGDVLDSALVTAWVGDERGLFTVDLRHDGVSTQPPQGWVSRGLPTVTSVGLRFDGVPASPLGAPGWYLTRPGFAWGGIGVAACWYGAALGVADALDRARDDEATALHRGRCDVALHAARCVLDDAARQVDGGDADGAAGAVLALRARSVVAGSVETVLREVAHACGPAPLAFDEAHAARVADLQIYVRQHHGERDVMALGRLRGSDG